MKKLCLNGGGSGTFCRRLILLPELDILVPNAAGEAARCGKEGKGMTVCVCENQEQAERRLPAFLEQPEPEKEILAEPLREALHLEPYLATGKIRRVLCGGDAGESGAVCDYAWILGLRDQCVQFGVAFRFRTTGCRFRKEGRLFQIGRSLQKEQARRAGIDYEPEGEQWKEQLFRRLSRSAFRSSFHLRPRERAYLEQKGMEVMEQHARDFVRQRLAPAEPANDGKQTPMKGHPVFLAQHATGTCCRNCLYKWHRIPKGRALSQAEQEYVVQVLMEWIRRQEHLAEAAEAGKNTPAPGKGAAT